jgi:hypothetical protein
VSGVVTTSLATLDVMRRAVKSGANLIVTSGPTFYSRTDSPAPPAGRGRGTAQPPSTSDPVFTAKNEFAVSEEAGMLEMADWIKTFIPEVPVQLVKAGEPFWVPR